MISDRIAALDTDLFKRIESQTSTDDKKALLAIHDAVAKHTTSFRYLEIGSHLGGSLQAVIADPRCTSVISIDPRPEWQPDDRPELEGWEYAGNSTERMLELLRAVPDSDLSKLETIEAGTDTIPPGRIPRPDFCFIDGEHTNRAALRDARFCRTVMQGAGVIAFHDFHIIEKAVLAFLRETPPPHRGYRLRTRIFVVELGMIPTLLGRPAVRTLLRRPRRGWIAANCVGLDTELLAVDMRRRRWR